MYRVNTAPASHDEFSIDLIGKNADINSARNKSFPAAVVNDIDIAGIDARHVGPNEQKAVPLHRPNGDIQFVPMTLKLIGAVEQANENALLVEIDRAATIEALGQAKNDILNRLLPSRNNHASEHSTRRMIMATETSIAFIMLMVLEAVALVRIQPPRASRALKLRNHRLV